MPRLEQEREAPRGYLPTSEEVRQCYLASVVLDYRVGEGHCPLVEIGELKDWAVLEVQLLYVLGCPQLRLAPLEKGHTGGAKEGGSKQGLTVDRCRETDQDVPSLL